MTAPRLIDLPSPAATEALARQLAPQLRAGDTLLLSGPTGAGKSHFARAVIQACQRAANHPPEDVPSPTYTLVQTYLAGSLEIWHADLYRLGDTSELEELGLTNAWDSAVALIEWPDRLGPESPADAVHIDLSLQDTGRLAKIDGPAATLDRLLEAVTA